MASINQDFVTYQGNAVSPIFTVKNSAGVAIDISGSTEIAWSAIRDDLDVPVISKTKTGGGITFVTDGTDGKFQVAILATDTASLSGSYIHQATVTDGDGNPTTVSVGRMQVGLAPTWTYDSTALRTNTLYQVRRLVGDVLASDQQLQDEEIRFAISLYSNVYLAAAECCREIAAQYSRKVNTVQGASGLQTNYSQQAIAYTLRAKELENRGMARGGTMPYMGGISIADKVAQQNDTDRVQPSFIIGMDDNLLNPSGSAPPVYIDGGPTGSGS